jgi:Fur family peroxide stress response transcriptional regulator
VDDLGFISVLVMAKQKKLTGVETKAANLTRQREVVLQIVNKSEQHPTAADVFEHAKKKLPGISYATVYNSLRYLKEAGLIREITFGKSASHYDGKTHRHDHAYCTSCGKLVDFDLAETVKLMRAAARRTHFKPETIHLTLLGLCPDCGSD